MGLLSGTDQNYYEGSDLGNYQFTSLDNIINQFMTVYVGDNKLISDAKRVDVAFHAQRTLAELSFDTFKSTKAQEITVPATLTMPIPRDYVNYVKVTFVDAAGIEHVVYPMSKTSNPTSITQNASGDYTFTAGALNTNAESKAWENYKSSTPDENQQPNLEYNDDTFWSAEGRRYGLDPQFSQVNGNFYIDELKGNIHFSSNLSGETIILKYISDSLGTDAEMQVHKLAEEAMYKQIAYAVLSTRANVPEYIVQRFKKEARASKRQAKLRLSNIKLEEITQILRGKSKQIKH
ncbi:MAG: hypothetical protein EBY39_08905 [Flavobacteriia bacterium]|nr:hypothetical protein [Flavobacteriia bacterium]